MHYTAGVARLASVAGSACVQYGVCRGRRTDHADLLLRNLGSGALGVGRGRQESVLFESAEIPPGQMRQYQRSD